MGPVPRHNPRTPSVRTTSFAVCQILTFVAFGRAALPASRTAAPLPPLDVGTFAAAGSCCTRVLITAHRRLVSYTRQVGREGRD